jgi:2-polyprenyl-3-methyl-5-hydroxy-6-metoxy-1,4-benzoquinol methylase
MDGDASRLLATLAKRDLDSQQRDYLRLHRRRYAVLVTGVRERLEQLPVERRNAPRVIDIGPGLQTELMRDAIATAHVDTIGFASDQAPPRAGERHIDFDLTHTAERERWPAVDQPYDIAVMAEVIEHLAVSPLAVLSCAASWLRPGGWLVLQTPNLLALHKRVRMLLGGNPLGPAGAIDHGSHNPRHFREYTLSELTQVARSTGEFELEEASIDNYFCRPSAAGRVYDRLTAILPASTRQGITAYLRST